MKKLLVFLVVAALPLAASAATITYDLVYNTSWDPTFSTSSTMLVPVTGGLGPAAGYDSTYLHQFDVEVSISGLATGEDLKQLGLGLTLTNVVDSGYGWIGNTSETVMVDPPGPVGPTATAVFATNADAGTAGDLLGILAMSNAAPAAVAQTGESGSTVSDLVGSVYVTWDSSAAGSVKVFGDPPGGSTWVIWTGNDTGTSTTIQTMASGTEVGDTVNLLPEPATMGLLALGALGLLRRRR